MNEGYEYNQRILYGYKCDACGYFRSMWEIDIMLQTQYLHLGNKYYCPRCWEYDENGDIVTADGKLWDIKTRKEVK